MKRLLCVSFILVLVTGIIGCLDQSIDHPVGKDTVKVVGNGKFQIGKFPDNLKLVMYDENNNVKIIVDEVNSFKELRNKLYVIGDEGKTYSIIDGETNICNIYTIINKKETNYIEYGNFVFYLDSYDDFTDNEKKIFENMSKK